MGFRTGAYAKVWDIKPSDKGYNSTDVRISISRKDKQSGEYVDEFSGWATCYAEAQKKIDTIQSGDKIKLAGVDVNRTYNKEKNENFVKFKIFDFEKAEPYTNSGSSGNSGDYNPADGSANEPGNITGNADYPW